VPPTKRKNGGHTISVLQPRIYQTKHEIHGARSVVVAMPIISWAIDELAGMVGHVRCSGCGWTLKAEIGSIKALVVRSNECFHFGQRLGRLGMGDDDLRERGEFRAVGPGFGFPEIGSGHALWAVYEGLFHSDDQNKTWQFAGNREPSLQGRIANNPRLTCNSQCVAMARYYEDQRDVGTIDDVHKSIEAVIANSVGNGERLLIENSDKPGRIALGRNIHMSIGISGRDHEKRAGCDEVAADVINVIDDLLAGAMTWLSGQFPQSFPSGNHFLEHGTLPTLLTPV